MEMSATSTHLGHVAVAVEVIEALAGKATMECRGVMGMASIKNMQDGLAELLNKEQFNKGVSATKDDDGDVHIDIYVHVHPREQLSKIAHQIQTKVKYNLNQIAGLNVSSVNVFIKHEST